MKFHSRSAKPPTYLGVSPQTVYLWVERKQIPHLRVMGRNIRFLKSDIEPFRATFTRFSGLLLQDESESWWMDCRDHAGERQKKSTNTDDWEEAQTLTPLPKGEQITVTGQRNWLSPKLDYNIVFALTPCTHPAVSGTRWFRRKGRGKLADALSQVEACRRIREWSKAPSMLKNPVSSLSTYWREPAVTFNPYWYEGYLNTLATNTRCRLLSRSRQLNQAECF